MRVALKIFQGGEEEKKGIDSAKRNLDSVKKTRTNKRGNRCGEKKVGEAKLWVNRGRKGIKNVLERKKVITRVNL